MIASTVRFRRFTPGDADAVWALHTEALRAVDAYIEVPGYYADLEDVEGQYLAKGGEFLVGEYEGRVVAIGGVQLQNSAVAALRRMRVAPDLQGRGLGRELLVRLERVAAARGCTRIELDTTVNQRAAQALFASAGYRQVRRGSKGGPLETIFYEKVLGGTGA